MAKKAAAPSKLKKPKNEAIPLGQKPEPKKKAKPKAKPKKEDNHEREATAGETDLIESRRAYVISYLMKRDGMDEEIAKMVVEGLEPEQIGDLWQEAQTVQGEAEQSEQAASATDVEPEPEPEIVDFTSTPLAEHETFAGLLIEVIDAAKRKNSAEKEYKTKKAELIGIVDGAGIKMNEQFMAFGNKLERYKGSSPRYLDATLLLEKGVSIDIINQCWKSTDYDDIRILVPKE